jgi:exo-1,4-beta-D-glucosaminidase
MEPQHSEHQRNLSEGWLIRASAEVSSPGESVSRPGFDTRGWIAASVPSTALAALVENGRCSDPYTGMSLKDIPREPFTSPWWYRTEFELSAAETKKTILLEFDGINYAADVWLNGRQIATADQARGAFRRFQYEISKAAVPGMNVLAVEVMPPKPGDFTTGFVDWNPPPPDRNMGLFRPVRLRFCEGVALENSFVRTDLKLDTLAEARLTISAEAVNHGDEVVQGALEGTIEGIRFRQDVHLQPRERKTVVFSSQEYPQLHVNNPRIWWPHDMGRSELYSLDFQFVIGSQVLDQNTVRFGIRDVADYRTPEGHRGFKINGREVLIKGAGWTDDLLLADTPRTMEAELQYVRHMNLNCIRCEGIWGKDRALYDLCDEYGILMMVGWSCHWEHEQYLGKPVDERYGGVTTAEDIELISRSWRDQLRWLRNHPSIFVWAVASDKLPAPELERRYIEIFSTDDPTRPYLASTGGVGSEQKIVCREELTSEVSGSSGVKMLGPYEYTPPVYWYTDTRRGGAYGFNTETSPGAAVPTLESLKKMIPPDHLWPIDEYWDFHCGLNEFSTLDKHRKVIAKRYGKTNNAEEFAGKAQTLNYELMRPMFEAFRVNAGRATGVIQWMLNAAWPKMYWQLYDWYLMPTGAFYGAKKACEPQQLVYHYGEKAVSFVGAGSRACPDGLRATTRGCPYGDIRVYDIESKLLLAARLPLNTEGKSSQKIFKLPRFDRISTTYFLSLRLLDANKAELARNFYWLSTKPDVLDYQAKVEPWEYYTPSKEYADLTLLNHLPPAQVDVGYELGETNAEARVELTNRSDRIAFFIELLLTEADNGEPIVPVFWQDNYVSLLPNETRMVSATFPVSRHRPVLTVRGWNVEQVCRVPVRA